MIQEDKGDKAATHIGGISARARQGAAINNEMVLKVDKPYCSQCAYLGIVLDCKTCWYSNFLQGNYDILFVGM